MYKRQYPDCTADFIAATENTVCEALGMHRSDYQGPHIRILAPLITLTKAETVALAMSYNSSYTALAHSHTCYAGEVPPCGKCHACVLRAEGFRQAGVADPLVERFEKKLQFADPQESLRRPKP